MIRPPGRLTPRDLNLRPRPQDDGRSGGIRTHDPLTPSQVRYQAALRSVASGEVASYRRAPRARQPAKSAFATPVPKTLIEAGLGDLEVFQHLPQALAPIIIQLGRPRRHSA